MGGCRGWLPIFLLAVMLCLAVTSLVSGKQANTAILVVGDNNDLSVAQLEINLRAKLKAMRDRGELDIPGLSQEFKAYNFAVAEQRQYCEERLGIGRGQLPFLALVELDSEGVPSNVLWSIQVQEVDSGIAAMMARLGRPYSVAASTSPVATSSFPEPSSSSSSATPGSPSSASSPGSQHASGVRPPDEQAALAVLTSFLDGLEAKHYPIVVAALGGGDQECVTAMQDAFTELQGGPNEPLLFDYAVIEAHMGADFGTCDIREEYQGPDGRTSINETLNLAKREGAWYIKAGPPNEELESVAEAGGTAAVRRRWGPAALAAFVYRSYSEGYTGSHESQLERTSCEFNLKNLGTALEMWSCDYNGRYPRTLFQITPDYLRVIPTCPAAGSSTYVYTVSHDPEAFTIYCSGNNHAHAGLGVNQPSYTSTAGLQP